MSSAAKVVLGGRTRELLQADLDRRLTQLPREVAQWNDSIAANQDGLGIHTTQIQALQKMMAGLTTRQQAQLQTLVAEPDLSVFSNSYYELLNDLGGTHDLWRIFRIIFDQRHDLLLRPLADISDLIAWDCYRTGLAQAAKWGLLPRDQFRPPPLTFLESSLTPATASNGESVETLGFSVRQYRDLMLPLPIVLYPVDQAASIWSMSSIAHEVGHNLDHDLDVRPGHRISDEFRKLLIGSVPDSREPQWRRWMDEIFADAIAVILCGTGFVVSMAGWTLGLGPGRAFGNFDSRAVHPPLFLRLRLLGQMLIMNQAPFEDAGKEIIALCDKQNRPAWEAPYEADTEIIARMLITQSIDPLGKRALRELNDDLSTDQARIAQLALHFLDSNQQRPKPDGDLKMPFRAVPAAASLAAANMDNPSPTALDALQQRAEAYFSAIPRPNKLAAPEVNLNFLAELTGRLRFGDLRDHKEDS